MALLYGIQGTQCGTDTANQFSWYTNMIYCLGRVYLLGAGYIGRATVLNKNNAKQAVSWATIR